MQLKILIGDTGKKHAFLPDVVSTGWLPNLSFVICHPSGPDSLWSPPGIARICLGHPIF